MSSTLVELAIVLGLILANGLFSMSEMAIVSSRKARLQQRADRGDRNAALALELAEQPTQILSTVQIGITLIGILTGTFGGAALANALESFLGQIPLVAPFKRVLAVAIVVSAITFLSLVVGELAPKRLALSQPESIAVKVAAPMRTLARFSSPVVYLLSMSTEALLRLVGSDLTPEPQVTEEEIKLLLQEGAIAGAVEETEQEILQRVLALGDRPAAAVMTSRRDIAWLDLNAPLTQNVDIILKSRHQRFPVCRDSLDEVMGVVQMRDLLAQFLTNQPLDFTTCLRQPLVMPETSGTLRILESFRESGLHVALIVDEYGVIQGLVTMNDMLEAIVGDLPDTDEPDAPRVVQREDGSWLVDGMLPIDRLREDLQMETELPGEKEGRYQTLAGFMIAHFGQIPQAADAFSWGEFRFEVMDMDGNRVDKILVQRLSGDAELLPVLPPD